MKGLFASFKDMFGNKKGFAVYGTQGGISTSLTLPEGFDPEKDRCPMVLLMHGFMSSKRLYPMPQLAKALAKEGIASVRFDFNAHGKSEGKFIDMTIANEISDAKAVLDYVRTLPFVTETAFVGHSQGGVVAGMLAGELEEDPGKPVCLVQLAPAAVLKDDAIAGQCMGVKYNPADPPEYVSVMFHKLGRTFIKAAQKLPIYETSGKYTGKVLLIHGKNDSIVPYSYCERYHQTYKDSEMILIEDEGHMMRKNKEQIIVSVTEFIKSNTTR